MKITRKQLRRIIAEQIATVTDDTIEDVVMKVLSDEGGAAGLEPIEDALEDLEDEDVSLPDEDLEDVVSDVTGVKRHADGDFIDTTQLESRIKRAITKQARLNERSSGNPALAAEERAIMQAIVGFVDKYRLTNSLDPSDFGDDKRIRTAVEDIINTILGDV